VLVTGERKSPVLTFANPTDTANNILKDLTTGEVTIITMDDVMLYQHVFVRAYQLVYAMFGDCLHYLISKEIKAGDPVGIFRELDKYLFGHQAKDVLKHSATSLRAPALVDLSVDTHTVHLPCPNLLHRPRTHRRTRSPGSTPKEERLLPWSQSTLLSQRTIAQLQEPREESYLLSTL
jgi:hypothetical protein